MSGVIFFETLKRNWTQMVYWGLGMGALAALMMVAIPDIETLDTMSDLMGSLPPAAMAAFGIEDMEAFSTPEGFIGFGYFLYALIILAIFAALAGLSIVSADEDEGILDVMLSLPVSRRRLLLEKFAVYALLSAGIVGIAHLGFVLTQSASQLDVDMNLLLIGSLNMLPSMLYLIAFTLLVTVLIRRRAIAMGVVIVYFVGSYMLDVMGGILAGTVGDGLQALSFFAYYNGDSVMLDGLNPLNVVLLLALTGAFLWLSLWAFERRDIGL